MRFFLILDHGDVVVDERNFKIIINFYIIIKSIRLLLEVDKVKMKERKI
jgi:hypothetical protein